MKGRLIFLILMLFGLYSFSQTEHELISENQKNDLRDGFLLLENDNIKEAEESFQKYIAPLSSYKKRREAYYEIALKYNNKLYFDLSISYAQKGD